MSTPNENAIFYYQSFCDGTLTGYVLYGDFLTPELALDHDPLTSASTSGKNSDAVSASFIVDFLTPVVVDTLAIQCNFSSFDISYSSNSSTWTSVGVFLCTDEFCLASFTQATARYWAVTCYTTIPANQEKQIVNLIISRKIIELPVLINNPIKKFVRFSTSNVKGGSIQFIPFPQYSKFSVELVFKNLTTNYSNYQLLKRLFSISPLLVYLYLSDEIEPLNSTALYLVNDTSDIELPLSTNIVMAGVDGKMTLEEV